MSEGGPIEYLFRQCGMDRAGPRPPNAIWVKLPPVGSALKPSDRICVSNKNLAVVDSGHRLLHIGTCPTFWT